MLSFRAMVALDFGFTQGPDLRQKGPRQVNGTVFIVTRPWKTFFPAYYNTSSKDFVLLYPCWSFTFDRLKVGRGYPPPPTTRRPIKKKDSHSTRHTVQHCLTTRCSTKMTPTQDTFHCHQHEMDVFCSLTALPLILPLEIRLWIFWLKIQREVQDQNKNGWSTHPCNACGKLLHQSSSFRLTICRNRAGN